MFSIVNKNRRGGNKTQAKSSEDATTTMMLRGRKNRRSIWKEQQEVHCGHRRMIRSPSPVPGQHQVAFKLVSDKRASIETVATSASSDDESSVASTARTVSERSIVSLLSRQRPSPAPLRQLHRPCSILKVSTQFESLAQAYCSSSSGLEEKKRKRKVSFFRVYIHSHQVILGDNPSVSAGPPLSIEWSSESSTSLPVEYYESRKEESGGRRSHANGLLRLDEETREKILRTLGYSRKEVDRAIRAVRAAQESRRKSILEQIMLARTLANTGVVVPSTPEKPKPRWL